MVRTSTITSFVIATVLEMIMLLTVMLTAVNAVVAVPWYDDTGTVKARDSARVAFCGTGTGMIVLITMPLSARFITDHITCHLSCPTPQSPNRVRGYDGRWW